MISKVVLALKQAPLLDDTQVDKKKWYDITNGIIDFYADKFSATYNVALSNRPRLHYKFSYKIPNIYRLAIVIINHQFDISLLTEKQLQIFLRYSESVDYDIDIDRNIWINATPAQSQAAYLRKAAIFTLNMIVNMNLGVVYSGQERIFFADDFKVLAAIKDNVKSDKQKLRALCWTALVDEKMKSYKLDSIYNEDRFNLIKTALVKHTHHLSSDFTDKQADLLLNLLCARLHNNIESDCFKNAKYISKSVQTWVDGLVVASMGVTHDMVAYFGVVKQGLESLNKYISESTYGYDEYTKRLECFNDFKKIINKNSLAIANTVIDQMSKRITTEQAQVAITSAHDEIKCATKKFQSQVPPQMSRILARAFTLAVSLVTLGVGALVIAFYNKVYYQKFALEIDGSYTGNQAGMVTKSVLNKSNSESYGVNMSALFQPAVNSKQQVENNVSENTLLATDNPMFQQQTAAAVVVH